MVILLGPTGAPDVAERVYSVPTTRFVKWLTKTPSELPDEVQAILVRSLFGSPPIFFGGVFNTLLISIVCALRVGSRAFVVWAVFESVICVLRVGTLIAANRRAATGRSTPTDLHMILALCWAASVGFGAFIGLVSGDWVVASMTCLSAAAMVGGICVRNFAAPRYVLAMILLSSGPLIPASLLSGQALALMVLVQAPMYALAMTIAAYHLNRLLVSTMISGIRYAESARRDDLTGLLNRAGLQESCGVARDGASEIRRGFAVFYVDLDLFKSVNDNFGHAAGDRVLQMAAERLRRIFRSCDHIARIGGDEFAVIAEGVSEIEAHQLADRIVAALVEPFAPLNGGSARVGASVGLAFSESAASLDDLLARADRALYKAKAAGRAQYRAFREGQQAA